MKKKKRKKGKNILKNLGNTVGFGRLLTPHNAARKGDIMHLIKSISKRD